VEWLSVLKSGKNYGMMASFESANGISRLGRIGSVALMAAGSSGRIAGEGIGNWETPGNMRHLESWSKLMRCNHTMNLFARCAGVSSLRLLTYAFLTVLVVNAAGCTAAVGAGIKLIGSAVDDADVKARKEQLMNADLAKADEMFGKPLDAFSDINSKRAWRSYRVPKNKDPFGKDRYVVEVAKGRIVAVSRVEKNSDLKIDLPRAIAIKSDVMGKPISECEALVDHGKPLVTVRSESTGLLTQLYEGRLIKNLQKPHYIVLSFDGQERCTNVHFLGVGASTRKDPLSE